MSFQFLRALQPSARPFSNSRRAIMSTTSPFAVDKPVEMAIKSKLESLLQPSDLKITNNSWQHRHHAPMRAQGGGSGESHFSVQVVSQAFTGKSTMQRHRMIYAALSEEFQNGLHALSLTTKTQEEMAMLQGKSS